MKFLGRHFSQPKLFLFGLLTASFFSHSPILAFPVKMVVSVPVADVRSELAERKPFDVHNQDFKQVTQVLYGEHVLGCREKDGWIEIRALEQQIFVNEKWYECCGWVRADQVEPVSEFEDHTVVVEESHANIYARLSAEKRVPCATVPFGSKLTGVPYCQGWWGVGLPNGEKGFIAARSIVSLSTLRDLPEQTLRARVMVNAKKFLGAPYVWGGRSFYNTQYRQITSADCSGMINICFRAIGMDIPRNSRSQYEQSNNLKGRLRPGDLVFLSDKETPARINHVMLYCGNDTLIEMHRGSTFKASAVTGTKRLGVPAEKLVNGQKTTHDYVFLGTYF